MNNIVSNDVRCKFNMIGMYSSLGKRCEEKATTEGYCTFHWEWRIKPELEARKALQNKESSI